MITPKTLSSILDSFMGRLSLALAEKFDDDIVVRLSSAVTSINEKMAGFSIEDIHTVEDLMKITEENILSEFSLAFRDSVEDIDIIVAQCWKDHMQALGVSIDEYI